MSNKHEERDRLIAGAYVRGETTLLAVGRKFGISEERVRQIVAKADRSKRVAARRLEQRITVMKLLKSHFQV